MGAEMYLYVEKFVDGKWHWVQNPSPPPEFGLIQWTGIRRPDWYRFLYQNRSHMHVLGGTDDGDNIPSVSSYKEEPPGMSAEMLDAVAGMLCHCQWLPLSILRDFDWTQKALMVARTYSPEELTKLGWLGNGDGTPYTDVQSHRWKAWRDQGYVETEIEMSEVAKDLLDLLDQIEATAQVDAKDIRLVFSIHF